MKKLLMISLLLASFTSCASNPKKDSTQYAKIENLEEALDQAESIASPDGRRILETSRSMIANQEILVGGCWNYINAVYDRVGFSSNLRSTLFKSKLQGPYLKSEVMIEAGDWLYFVNHTYGDIEHSAIFVAWIDEDKKVALMVSYVGGNQKRPGIYKKFTLNNVYNVIRPRD